MGLRGYLLKRLLNTIVLVVFVICVNYVIFEEIPGTQGAIALLAENPKIPPETKAIIIAREETRFGIRCATNPDGSGVPCPIWTKFEHYFISMATFQFGRSFQTGNTVVHDLVNTGRLVNTLTLLGASSIMAIIIGVFLGAIAARKRGGLFDSSMVTTSLTTFSLPTFWLGLVLIYIFAFLLHWFPTGGVIPSEWTSSPAAFPSNFFLQIPGRLQHLFLPALTLTLFFYGGFLLLTRATMIEALSEDYITTARAKGVPERTVIYKHALKNASLPLVTAVALQFGFLLSGAIITETVFNWDGLGLWLFNAIGSKDGPVLQAMFFIVALCVIVANLAADIIYGVIDPRIRYE